MLALVTCLAARHLDTDLPLLQRELPDATVVEWDSTIDWAAFDVVIIRSTWDYHERRTEFLDWARHVESVSALWNPVELIEWNTDKRYLDDLARQGIPVVPTTYVRPGDDVGDVAAGDVVVKPSVGAGSNGVVRSHGDPEVARAHVERLHAAGHVALVQPYLDHVDERGETGLVFFAGAFSHAFGKRAILAAPVSWAGGVFAEEHTEPRTASPAELALGHDVMRLLPPTAYARIDLLPTAEGPVVLEVEVTEPSFFLECDPSSPARAAAAFRSLAR